MPSIIPDDDLSELETVSFDAAHGRCASSATMSGRAASCLPTAIITRRSAAAPATTRITGCLVDHWGASGFIDGEVKRRTKITLALVLIALPPAYYALPRIVARYEHPSFTERFEPLAAKCGVLAALAGAEPIPCTTANQVNCELKGDLLRRFDVGTSPLGRTARSG
jgi:hypothetical protein